jgi:hypothetical protein
MHIIECPLCTITEQCLARRSWRERLLSWPWRPWVATRMVDIEVPDPHCHTFGNVMVCHPAVAQRVRENLSRLGRGG